MSKEKVVLAYSGGLDTSVAVKWLQDNYNYDVIAVALDVGEGKDLDFIKEKALNVGAIKSYVVDAKSIYAEEYVLPALQANLLYEGKYPLISALSRPLIAKILVDIAEKEGAVAVAHGCTGKGNDQVRFDVAFTALNPSLKIVAPVREWAMSRDEEIAYAKEHGIPVPVDVDNPFSIDQNLWGRSNECGVLEDPWVEAPKEAYELTVDPVDAPDTPQVVQLTFEQGKPVSLDGTSMPLEKLILQLNEIAGKHGVGRIDHVENRLVGIKSREIYEAPAALTLIAAHQELEALTLPREVAQFKPMIEQKLSQTVYDGLWYSPLTDALKAFINETQQHVSGTVKVKLYKGHAQVVGRESAQSLYDFDLATYNAEDAFDHEAALGFIKLWGLPTKVHATVNQTHAKKAISTEEAVVDVKEAVKQ
ncbi:argininosuccinate synthase [Virgibacillus halodenitrificans]|uniref:Argininosuccinate synthase n=1 Tax=Virgibacillus halodenitrificans TaxID=1482 RepID=A0AAC9J6M8_VIRHA|nr:argininosuccinate synthase [Virgibacillus halodenitrificans]APC49919.1 argininosuccinate synthase [Virgibacillus halodenitrificans]MCG1030254.1 argininosuccinate synthase [Virgibacillus halodenitrificans]MEC2157847.1 argininosuccinate synthase [Virgibacillus halodenitrificans]MYL58775.1 argininosuccinate synthase [Virgibacillus halodenitrificans]WHX25830.1 argininosuccinate synthase [Virgibacillus halodenitrificans]